MRLITPVYANEGVAQAEARLAEFTRAIVPILNEFLPKQVRRLERVRPAADQTEVEVMDSADLAQPKLAFVRA
jgi:hypothetical protein